jgi:Holliday junction resolvasome RuvABC endonuclease subunit
VNVLGIDPASKTLGCAWLSSEYGLVVQKFVVKPSRRDVEIKGLVNQLRMYSPVLWYPDEIYVEEPVVAGPRNLRSTLLIAETVGALMGDLRALVTLVPVTSWKKGTTGHGNATKSDVALWLKSTYPDYDAKCAGDQDLIDAVCIALYGRDMRNGSVGRGNPVD